MYLSEDIITSKRKELEEINWCGNHWRYPQSCTPSKKDCVYYARWEYIEETDDIKFTVQTTNTEKWTGIGFSDNTRMVKYNFNSFL